MLSQYPRDLIHDLDVLQFDLMVDRPVLSFDVRDYDFLTTFLVVL